MEGKILVFVVEKNMAIICIHHCLNEYIAGSL